MKWYEIFAFITSLIALPPSLAFYFRARKKEHLIQQEANFSFWKRFLALVISVLPILLMSFPSIFSSFIKEITPNSFFIVIVAWLFLLILLIAISYFLIKKINNNSSLINKSLNSLSLNFQILSYFLPLEIAHVFVDRVSKGTGYLTDFFFRKELPIIYCLGFFIVIFYTIFYHFIFAFKITQKIFAFKKMLKRLLLLSIHIVLSLSLMILIYNGRIIDVLIEFSLFFIPPIILILIFILELVDNFRTRKNKQIKTNFQ